MFRIKYVIPALILASLLLVAEIVIIRSASEYEPKEEAVFAAGKIPKGTTITEDIIKVKKVDAGALHKLSFRRKDEVIGKAANSDIEQDEMILSSRVDSPQNIRTISTQEPGARLFTVEFKGDQANGWQLKTGDYVDIIFIPQKVDSRNEADQHGILRPECPPGRAVRLERVRVAALIDDYGNIIESAGKRGSPRYISFEVAKGQDEFLAYAKANGRLEISVAPD